MLFGKLEKQPACLCRVPVPAVGFIYAVADIAAYIAFFVVPDAQIA